MKIYRRSYGGGTYKLDCKTVRIFEYSSTREQSNKGFFSLTSHANLVPRSPTAKRKPHGRVRLACFARVRLLRHALPIPLLILRKKPTVLQSTYKLAPHHTNVYKFSQLSAAISSFVFNKSLLNTAIFLIFSRVDRFSLSYSCQKLKKQRKDLFTSIFEYQGN